MKHGFIKQDEFLYYVLGQEDPETEKYGFAVIEFGESGPFFNNIPFFDGNKPTKSDFKKISNKNRKISIKIVFEKL